MFEFTHLTTAISCSNMLHLGPVADATALISGGLSRRWMTEALRTMSPVFSVITNIAWSTACDADTAAAHQLVYLTVASSCAWSRDTRMTLLSCMVWAVFSMLKGPGDSWQEISNVSRNGHTLKHLHIPEGNLARKNWRSKSFPAHISCVTFSSAGRSLVEPKKQ